MKPGSLLIPAVLAILITSTLEVASCSKNNSGKPQLTLVSVNTTVQVNDSMRATFKFSDGSAVSNGMFWAIRERQNVNPLSYMSGSDTSTQQIPSFSANNGQLYFSLPWQGYLNETNTENDTFVFKFYIMTPDSVYSDTVTSPQVVVLYQ